MSGSKWKMKPVIEPKTGQLYHVSWGYRNGVVGRCVEVNNETRTVKLITPKTKKPFANPVNFSDLRHTRKNEIKNPH
jgi:hypothetical protein